MVPPKSVDTGKSTKTNKFTNIPLEIKQSTSGGAHRIARRREFSAIAVSSIVASVLVLLLIQFAVSQIQKFFDSYRIVSQPIVQIKFNSPFRLEARELVSPLAVPTPTPSPSPTPTPTPKVSYSGKASYYSEAGCLGCDPNLIMANGERLDDNKKTIALTPEVVSKHKLINKEVRVINTDTMMFTTARVTDTGGFSKYNRVADLSVATRDSINCNDLCNVTVELQ